MLPQLLPANLLGLLVAFFSPSARGEGVLHRAANAASNAAGEQAARRALKFLPEHRIALAKALGGVAMLPTLTAIAIVPCSLALVKKAYAFSFSYALSTTAIGLALLLPHRLSLLDAPSQAFSLSATDARPVVAAKLHAALLLVHGLRLLIFLRARAKRWPGWAAKVEAHEGGSPEALGQRLPLVLGAALFYALLAAPAATHAAAAAGALMHGGVSYVTIIGLTLCACGLLLESTADLHKLRKKAAAKSTQDKEAEHEVPVMDGPFALCRHANYLGEMIFWTGSFVAGLHATFASAGKGGDLTWRLLGSMGGLIGMLAVMLGSSARLDAAQRRKYCAAEHPEHAQYERYCARCACLMPFVGGCEQSKTKKA